MIGGLIAGALSGGGQAVQQNAQNTLETRRQEALKRLDNDLALGRMEVENEYQVARDETQQGYAQDNAQLQHGLSMEQERYRQGQQNTRAAINRNDWNVMQTADGTPVRINARTGTLEPISGSENFSFGSGGNLSDREQARIEMLVSERESIMEQTMGQTSEEQAARLGEIDSQLETMLGGTGGGGLLGGIRRELGIDGSNPPSTANPEQPESEDGSATPPPRPSINSVDDIEAEVRAERKAEGDQRALKQQTSDIENEVTQIRGMAAKMGQGPRISADERARLGQQVRERGNQLLEQYDLDDRQIERLKTAIENAVQYGG